MGMHDLSLTGRAGSILWALILSALFYVVGFATTGWKVHGNYHLGLWEACSCGYTHNLQDEGWFQATQAMITIGLVGVILSFIIAVLYIFVSFVNKNTLVVCLALFACLSVLFMTIGFVIFGIKTTHQSYSFVFSILGGVAMLVAAVLSILQWNASK